MRFVAVLAFAVVVWAAFFSLYRTSDESGSNYGILSAVVVAAATGIGQLSSVQGWLVSPKSRRKDLIEGMAQVLVINICRGRTVTDNLLQLRVHVWEVPLWYRRFFRYKFRAWVKRCLKRTVPRVTRMVPRPTLRRVAAFGLKKHPPTGVQFRKGDSLVGVCIANNDRSETLFIDISQQDYRDALASPDEEAWKNRGKDITRNLPLEDAKKLARTYGHVMAKVIQDPDTGEAIGCATVSLGGANNLSRAILHNQKIRGDFDQFAEVVGRSLA